jgi:hypothetical protein
MRILVLGEWDWEKCYSIDEGACGCIYRQFKDSPKRMNEMNELNISMNKTLPIDN